MASRLKSRGLGTPSSSFHNSFFDGLPSSYTPGTTGQLQNQAQAIDTGSQMERPGRNLMNKDMMTFGGVAADLADQALFMEEEENKGETGANNGSNF